jgi:hypothetical protein
MSYQHGAVRNRKRVAAGLVVPALLASVCGCGGSRSPGDEASAAARSAAPSAAPSESGRPQRRYALPTWDRICATARATGIVVKTVEKDSDSQFERFHPSSARQ